MPGKACRDERPNLKIFPDKFPVSTEMQREGRSLKTECTASKSKLFIMWNLLAMIQPDLAAESGFHLSLENLS